MEGRISKYMRMKDGSKVSFAVKPRETLQFNIDNNKVETIMCATPRMAHPMPLRATQEIMSSSIVMATAKHSMTNSKEEAINAVICGKSDLAIIPGIVPTEMLEGTSLSVLATIQPIDTDMKYLRRHHVIGVKTEQA